MEENIEKIHARRLIIFDEMCRSSRALFDRKNMEYRDSIRLFGFVGAVQQLVGSVIRLLTLSDNIDKNRGKIIDLLMDTHNYANIAMIMLNDQNYYGVLTNPFMASEIAEKKNLEKEDKNV